MPSPTKSLIVVSNRLPISITQKNNELEITNSAGGLASALMGVQEKIPFKWIGWPGASFFEKQEDEIKQKLHKKNLYPVFINREEEGHYYHTICNSFLWPIFHYCTNHVIHSQESWNFYEKVNQHFADEVILQADLGATVWVHDFHLFLLPKLIREKRPDLKIGFFLHIPFPSSEVYRMLPKRKEILEGILGSDYIGFHTSDYARHFRLSCHRVLGLDSNLDGISYTGRKIGLGIHPIGMNIASFNEILSKPAYYSYIQEIKERYNCYKVILGVERLDYTKGISLKLKAFELFLEQNPSMIGKVILLQIIVPSRLDSSDYKDYRSEIEELVGRINGKYSKPGYTPIQYIYRNLPLAELIALYCLADICMVTSIRDGMNLVAQEYVYCSEKANANGTLILSEFAGASHHLPHALIINPYDIESVAETLKTAIDIPSISRRTNLKKMTEFIESLDSPIWAQAFLAKLELQATKNAIHYKAPLLSNKVAQQIKEQAALASHREIILDYDGTLREITLSPMEARPTKEIISLLTELSSQPNTRVHIVSGRDHSNLQTWLGHLNINLSAEHGYLKKSASEKEWQPLKEADLSWINHVKAILEKAVDEVPGSHLEIKSSVLSWHYRMADLDYGQWRANELYTTLIQELSNLPVEIIPGKKVIEVRACGVSKAKYIEHILKDVPEDAFILCMGDDLTDQEMYPALPKSAYSIHVADHSSKAKHVIDSPMQVRELLKSLVNPVTQSSEPVSLD